MMKSKLLNNQMTEEQYQDNFNRLDGEFQAYLVQLRAEHRHLLIATAIAKSYLEVHCQDDRKGRIAAKSCAQALGEPTE